MCPRQSHLSNTKFFVAVITISPLLARQQLKSQFTTVALRVLDYPSSLRTKANRPLQYNKTPPI